MLNALILAAALATATPTFSTAQAVVQAPVQAQVPAQPQPAPGAPAPEVNFPILSPAVASSDCGALLATPAYCVTASLTEIGTLAESYIGTLAQVGWLAADGDDNRVIFVRRKDSGVCDGLQMIAFYDESKPVTPTTMGYLGFAVIPGNICRASAAGDQVPVQPQ